MKKIRFLIFLSPCLLFTSNWTAGGGGNWNNASNWDAGVPNAPDAIAIFPSPAASSTITLDISPTVGTLTTTGGAGTYIFTPTSSTIHFAGTSPVFTINGSPCTCNCKFSVDNSTSFNINTVLVLNYGISGSGSLTKNNSGLFVVNSACTYAGSTTLNAGSMYLIASNALPSSTDLVMNGGTLILINNSQSAGSLSGTAGTINLSSSALTLTVGSSNANTSFSGTITGTGKLTKVGTGTLTLSGANAYTSGTNIQAGAISIGADNNLGTGNITMDTATLQTTGSFSTSKGISLNGDGTFLVSPGVTTTCLGEISGSGNLIKTGTGTLVLSHENTYTGSTTIEEGNLRAGAANVLSETSPISVTSLFNLNNFHQSIGSLSGSGSVSLGSATLTSGNDNTDTTFSGIISGTGGITKVGTGTFILSNANTYTGTTAISEGTLRAGAINILSTLSPVSVAGTFDINNFDQSIGSLSGSGNISLGSATLTLGNDNTDTNFSGIISGTGGITKVGTGTFTVSHANTYTGNTLISGGTLKAGSINVLPANTDVIVEETFDLNNFNQNIGSLTGAGDVHLGSAVLTVGNNNTDDTFSGVISEAGGITKVGTGTFSLSSANTYTGPTTITEGTLKANIANAISSNTALTVNDTFDLHDFHQNVGSLQGVGDIFLGTAMLTVGNDNTNTTFSGTISGTGSLVKVGTGTLLLTGNNNYTGTTTVNAGTLTVNENITSNVTVETAATLGGSGTIIGDVDVHGAVRPGSSIETLHIDGNQNFATGSTYEVEFSSAASDLLDVSGSVTINSGVNLELIPMSGIGSYPPYRRYTIIQTQGGVSGKFDNIITAYPALIGEISYDDPNTVELIVNAIPFSFLVEGGNPGAVAAYIDTLTPLLEGSDLDNVIETIQRLDIEGMRSAFDQMHCALYKGLVLSQENTLNQMCSLTRQRTDDLCRAFCVKEYADQKDIGIWGSSFYDYYNQNSIKDLDGFHTNTVGVIVGFDRQIMHRHFLGIAGGYTFSNVDWKENHGKADIDSFYCLLYYSWFNQWLNVNSSIVKAYSCFDSHRNIQFSDINRTAHNLHNGKELAAHLDGGSSFAFMGLDLRPFGSVDAFYLKENSFTETGAKSLNLDVKKTEYWLLRTELGSHFARCFLDKRKWVGDVKLSWIRETRFMGKHYYCQLVDQPNYFRVNGINPDRNIFAPGFSLLIIFLENQGQFALRYDGEFAKHYVNHIISLQMLFNF